MNTAADEEENEPVGTSCCALCGIAEIDDVKLIPCDGCDLVKYCSDECQKDHESEHEEDCKRRAAELRDELLFKQPEDTYLGDCPICCLPLPLDEKFSRMTCCSKLICQGCEIANGMRELRMMQVPTCPFCRESVPITDEDIDKRRMKRIEANDPVAMCQEGRVQYEKGDYSKAFEYCAKAAELGNAEAHPLLAYLYLKGQGVQKDEGKYIHHTEEAAILGDPGARYNLGIHEWKNGNFERAVKHFIIASAQGHSLSIKKLLKAFKEGYIEKEELAAALREQKAAVDATKSPQREKARKAVAKIRSDKSEIYRRRANILLPLYTDRTQTENT